MGTMMRVALVVCMAGCAAEKAEGPPPNVMAEPPPQQSAEQITVSAERHDAIERTFARKAQELQSCWTDEYEKTHNRKLEGDVTLQIRVSPQGSATDVKVLNTTIKSANIEQCVVTAVSGWSFPEGQATVPYMRTVHLGAQF